MSKFIHPTETVEVAGKVYTLMRGFTKTKYKYEPCVSYAVDFDGATWGLNRYFWKADVRLVAVVETEGNQPEYFLIKKPGHDPWFCDLDRDYETRIESSVLGIQKDLTDAISRVRKLQLLLS